MTTLETVLQDKFGYTSFRVGQKEAIESVLKKEDTLVMLPTGTGKSLCYQLPAYMLDGVTLIVSPLLSLMQDQVEGLRLRGEKQVAALNSLTSYSEKRRVFNNIHQYKFIYTSPEMLQNIQVMAALKRVKISLFVIDEAHCISHWGTDFRPDYLMLANIRNKLGNPTTMALTATATKQVRKEIIQFLGLDILRTKQIVHSVDREEIKFVVEVCDGNKEEKLTEYLKKLTGPGIIYFTSKKLADAWAEKIYLELGMKASSYHADLEADDKIKIQQQFLNNHLQVICATSAFGMGFNKEDIRFIIHYHIPGSPEMYLQEIGRASRDGEKGVAVLLYTPGDEQIQQWFIETSLPDRAALLQGTNKNTQMLVDDVIQKLVQFFMDQSKSVDEAMEKIKERKRIKNIQLYFMMEYVYHKGCNRNFLLSYFDERKDSELKQCCSNCDLNINQLIEEINELHILDTNENETENMQPWERVFESLYNNLQL